MPVHEQRIASAGHARAEALARHIADHAEAALATAGGRVFGVFRPVIGLPQSWVVTVVEWPDAIAAQHHGHAVLSGLDGVETVDRDIWTPTLRPAPGERPEDAGGYYSHRAFDIAEEDWPRFRDLTAEAWGNWEATHAARTAGFWLCAHSPGPDLVRVRLMAWYESLEAWEKSRWWNANAKAGSEAAFGRFRERARMFRETRVSILTRIAPGER